MPQDAFVLKIQRELCQPIWPPNSFGTSEKRASISNNTGNEDHEESSKPSQRDKNKTRDRDVETLRLES